MTWPKSVTDKRFPDFDKQLAKHKQKLDEDEEYWRYRADRFHEDDDVKDGSIMGDLRDIGSGIKTWFYIGIGVIVGLIALLIWKW